jgi:hypothetical protein
MNENLNLISGNKGIERITLAAEMLHQKILTHVNTQTGQTFSTYSPWMCAYEKLELLLPLFKTPLPLFLANREQLSLIEKAYLSGDSVGLGYLGMDDPRVEIFVDVADFAPWGESVIRNTMDLISSSSEILYRQFMTLVKTIVPFVVKDSNIDDPDMEPGTSSQRAKGAIFHTLPKSNSAIDTFDFAVNLVHELGHQTLMIYQAGDSILSSPLNAPVWSAIRKNQRPAIMCVHAVAALSFMLLFVNASIANKKLCSSVNQHAMIRRNKIQEDLSIGIEILMNNCTFSLLGQLLMKDFKECLHSKQIHS